ncbi:prolyl oligopeptidase family serine peptidase [Tengunoibacter tsumagoiensis]|uniref:prolyl oligopeptidase n=1 Tax=Tengunoibacter tsumagoiensis TaxID=2014871 RepID=A0A401ZVS3_9CHLR|nr:prolyl oligopeptidase family serine peptidase [Tengunoibacter tsumagoiensis]GCE10860.1 prolyl endopeptidase [Tengunoibacter tsumagoiensis]
MKQPVARRDGTVDEYHGRQIADPYRWLEDDTAVETQEWSQAQHQCTRAYLDAIPMREHIKARYTELIDYPKWSTPYQVGDSYHFFYNTGLQNQSLLYIEPKQVQRSREHPLASARLVLDPNTLSADGTVALTNIAFSKDGSLLTYGTSQSGSDWQELHIRRVVEGTDYPEVLKWCKFSGIAWRHDNSGFYYNRFPEPGSVPAEDQSNFSTVYWHRLGTPQSEDVLAFERPDAKELGFSPFITDDGKYLILNVWHGTDAQNRLYYRPVLSAHEDEATNTQSFVRLLDEADASYQFVGNDGATFYFQTDLQAPHGRLIAIDTEQPECEHWRELIAEQEDVLAFAFVAHQHFVLAYMHDAHHKMQVHRKDGSFLRQIELPMLGSIIDASGRPDGDEFFFNFTSYLYPPTIFRYTFADEKVELWHQTESKFDPSNYETTQVFYPSKDGTRVPMFLTYKKGLTLNGNNPVLIYGYGGFDISMTPGFSITPLLWAEQGGIYAVANLRGGNEYGEEWHEAGMLEHKQNVFDDFIAAAEWLIEQGYTHASRVAIMGGSNGGLLVAACLVQRPDLYGAVVCRVPVIDMLRYHKFTVGRYWTGEYGNAEQSAEQFAFMYAYSPLHNVREGVAYPPTLIMTADTDDRVVPGHARKFAATLQQANGGEKPIFLRVEFKAGHGMGKPTTKVIDEESDILAFLCQTFDLS